MWAGYLPWPVPALAVDAFNVVQKRIVHGYVTWNWSGQQIFHIKFVYRESVGDYATKVRRIPLWIEYNKQNLVMQGITVGSMPDMDPSRYNLHSCPQNCIFVICKIWKTCVQQHLRITDDIAALKCRTLPSSVQWNKIRKLTRISTDFYNKSTKHCYKVHPNNNPHKQRLWSVIVVNKNLNM